MPSAEQLKEVERQNRISGVKLIRDQGYTGAGWNVAQLESSTSDHGEECVNRILEIAPGMKVYRAQSTVTIGKNGVTATCKYDGKTYDLEDFIKEYNIKFITKSIGGKPVDEAYSAYLQNLIDNYDIIPVTPAGNEGLDGLTTAFPINVSIVVGAVAISDSGRISVTNYSGRGKIDFAYFPGFGNGTSFCAPAIVGVLGLLFEKYGGRSKDQAKELLKQFCGGKQYNEKVGWGVPIMNDSYKETEVTNHMIRFNNLPVDGPLRITSKYGPRNTGIPGASKFHQGIDLGRDFSKVETNLLSVAAGTVAANYWNKYRGWVVVIQHSGFRTLYQHLKEKSPLGIGTAVKSGDVLGVMGNSSDPDVLSVSTHLHFELIADGKNIDPELYFDLEVEDLTREETLALIKEVLTGANTKPSAWAKESWEKAKADGITDGTNPKGYITREQAAAMIERVLAK